MRNQRGITLIALVITIIVLLILAGVSIAMLTGDNGILKNADRAAKETAIANAKEKVSTEVNEAMTNYYADKYADDQDVDLYDVVATAVYDCEGTEDGATITVTPDTKPTTTPAEITVTVTYDSVTVATGTVTTGGVFTWAQDEEST